MTLQIIPWAPQQATAPARPAPPQLPPAALAALSPLPDAFLIASTRGQLPAPPSFFASLPVIGPAMGWTVPVVTAVSGWTDRVVHPVVGWTNRVWLKPIQIDPPRPLGAWQQAPSPDWRVGGTVISEVAASLGHRRGQPIHDPKVIRAMLEKASQLYGVPAEYLARVGELESSGQHFNRNGSVKSAAAVGLMQIEKGAFPALMKGGPAHAVNNAYDLGNNIAIGAMQLRQYLNKEIKESGYRGNDPWRDLGPLLDIAYNAGSGALSKAQQIARQRGLDPYNWQHLLLGRTMQVGLWGRLDIRPGDIANAPLTQSTNYYHQLYAAKGQGSKYPVEWRNSGMVSAFDFDGNGVTTKTELVLKRTLFLVTGKRYKA